jgi:membrane protein
MSDGIDLSVSAIAAGVTAALWRADVDSLPRWRGASLRAARIAYAVVRDLREGQLTLRAMSLVYTTILSLVPLLAISFSVLKGFGVHNQIEPLLLNLFAPLGDKGVEVAERIVGFVENMKVGVLGSLGFLLLFYTVVSLMQKIERSFNYVWHIATERSLAQRFRDYVSVLLVGPTLVFSSVGITASVMGSDAVAAVAAIQPFGFLVEVVGRVLPYLMIMAAFAFMYTFVPNTRVTLRAALAGGIIAGLLWNSIGWAFASFVVTSAKYTAIYSTFATLILFFIWLNLGWLVLLIGADIAFYVQNPERIRVGREGTVAGNATRERLALMAARAIVGKFYAGEPPPGADRLAAELAAPSDALDAVLGAFERTGLVTRTAGDPPGYVPARPPEATPLRAVLDAVRGEAGLPPHRTPDLASAPAVDRLMEQVNSGVDGALAGRTLKDLATGDDSPGPDRAAGPVQLA